MRLRDHVRRALHDLDAPEPGRHQRVPDDVQSLERRRALRGRPAARRRDLERLPGGLRPGNVASARHAVAAGHGPCRADGSTPLLPQAIVQLAPIEQPREGAPGWPPSFLFDRISALPMARSLFVLSLLAALLLLGDARPGLAQSTTAPVDPVGALLEQGGALVRAGQMRRAEEKFNEALKRDPRNLDALIWLGEIALSRKDVARAQTLAKQAQAINPAHAATHALQ